jgi:hypothetical protein
MASLRPPLSCALAGLTAGLIPIAVTPAAVQAGCRYLQPIGSGNTPIVSKQVGPGRLLGKTNWNTDFIVDRPYASYR